MNVFLKRFDLAKEFSAIGLKKLVPGQGGIAWIKYFEKWAPLNGEH